MKRIILLLLGLFASNYVSAQWQENGGPSGGNIEEIVNIGSVLYISALNGGIYKSIDNGDTWTQSNFGLGYNKRVEDLAVYDDFLYASIFDHGIYRSEDDGENWTPINSGIENETFNCITVQNLDIFASNSFGGIYYSSDNGSSWQDRSEGVEEIYFQDLAFFKSAIYAGGASLFNSFDNGETWSEIEIPGLGVNGITSMLATENKLYVGDVGHIFISQNGEDWTKCKLNVNATITNIGSSADTVYFTTSSGRFYFSLDEGLNWVLVENNETINFANDIHLLEDKMLMSTSEGLYASLNGGLDWVESNEGITALQISALTVQGSDLFAGTDRQGVFRFGTQGNWTKINSGLEGLNAKSIHDIIILEDNIYLATEGGVFLSSNNGDSWQRISSLEPNIVTGKLAYDDGIFVLESNLGIYISKDSTKTWSLAESEGLNLNAALEAMKIVGDTIVISNNIGEMYLSENVGSSWSNISITGDYFLTYDIQFENNKMYVATTKGLLFTEDLGKNWMYFNNDSKSINSIIVSNNKIFAGTSEGVFFTTESRETWYEFNEGLKNVMINELAFSEDRFFAGTFASSVWETMLSDANLPPIIKGVSSNLVTDENIPLTLELTDLVVEDDNVFPDDFTLSVKGGDNYTFENTTIIPKTGFFGKLMVPVYVNDGNLNSSDFIVSIDIIEVLGLENSFIKENFSVYPNPFQNALNISSNFHLNEPYQINVYSRTGQRIYAKEIVSKTISINTTLWPTDIYIIQIVSGDKTGAMKLIKE